MSTDTLLPGPREIAAALIARDEMPAEKGDIGPQGMEGKAGEFGPPGPQGAKGDPGRNGTNGSNGLVGPKGPIGPGGPRGPKGEKGDKGDEGERGPIGPMGPTGAVGSGRALFPRPGGGSGSGTQDIEAVLTAGDDAGGQEITNLGQVTVNPDASRLYGLLIQALAGFDNVFNAFIRVYDEFGNEIFNMDTGGFDQYALPGGHTHVALRENDTGNISELSSNDATGLNLGSGAVGPSFAQIAAELGLQMKAFVPAVAAPVSKGQLYYDDSTGAPGFRWRGKDDAGTNFSGRVGLAGSSQTYTESNVTTDRAFNANATSIDELADVLGTLIVDLRARGVVA